jgi:hypothetical protein
MEANSLGRNGLSRGRKKLILVCLESVSGGIPAPRTDSISIPVRVHHNRALHPDVARGFGQLKREDAKRDKAALLITFYVFTFHALPPSPFTPSHN